MTFAVCICKSGKQDQENLNNSSKTVGQPNGITLVRSQFLFYLILSMISMKEKLNSYDVNKEKEVWECVEGNVLAPLYHREVKSRVFGGTVNYTTLINALGPVSLAGIYWYLYLIIL